MSAKANEDYQDECTATDPSSRRLPSTLSEYCSACLGVLDEDLDRRSVAVVRGAYDDLNNYSILGQLDIGWKRSLVQRAVQEPVLDRVMGSMCGMAIGDALGHPYEFLPAQDVPGKAHFDLATMCFHGESNSFGLKRGQWTDDASMGLCMADSLILRQQYDGSDIRVRFWCWWNRAYNNAFRKDPSRKSSVGLGGNISKSLSCISRLRGGEKPPPTYQAGTEDAGNGSLMRFTPIALFFHAASLDEVYHYARMSSYTTHPGIIAAEACSFLAHLIVRAVNRPPGRVDPKAFLDTSAAEYYEASGLSKRSGWGYDQMRWLVTSTPVNDTEKCWDWRREQQDIAGTLRARGSRYNGYPVSSGYFGSYSLDGLALALWSVYHTTSFDEAVAKSINLCGDADSHGSITGQLAGALYGYSAINPQFVKWLTRWDDHEFAVRGLLLHHVGAARKSEHGRGAKLQRLVDATREEDLDVRPLLTRQYHSAFQEDTKQVVEKGGGEEDAEASDAAVGMPPGPELLRARSGQ